MQNKLIYQIKFKYFFLLLILFLVSFSHSYANEPRFEQLIKDEQFGGFKAHYQTISCDDLSGQIGELTVSVIPVVSGASAHAYFRRPSENSASPLVTNLRTSETITLGTRYIQADATFSFPTPIDVDGEMCDGVDYVQFAIITTGNTSVAGSLQDPYENGEAAGTLVPSSGADMYFIINGSAEVNHPPALDFIGDQVIEEGSFISLSISATDPDGDTVTLSATNTPSGSSFNPSTGVFSWTPGFDDAGEYQVIFTATEDSPEMLFDTATVTITVNNVNRAPVLSSIGNKVINEGSTLQFTLSATDPDGDAVTLSATNTPSGSSFNSITGVFSWTPTYNDAGNYTDVEFIATDDGEPMELTMELITITVGDVNRAPIIVNPGPQEVLEGSTLQFTLLATDPDGDIITLSATNTPAGSSFNPSTGVFSWTPNLSDSAVYTVTFTASDNGTPVEQSNIDVIVTVGDNPTPVEQTEDLIEDIVEFDFPQNVENSYMANLQKVEQFILTGKINAAINQLNAFISKLETDYQNSEIDEQEYLYLKQLAEQIISDISGT